MQWPGDGRRDMATRIVLSGGPADGRQVVVADDVHRLMVPRSGVEMMAYAPRQFHWMRHAKTETYWMPIDWTEAQATAWLANDAGYGNDVERFLAEA